jgi:hypothetical protein
LVARVVHKRSQEELGPLLLWLVENDGVLRTDCWRGYMSLMKTGALHGKTVVHKTVNHSRTFKEKDGTHTNSIEGMWRVLRWEVKRRWSALGVSELKVLSARVQFGVWVINRRLAHKHDNKADTLFQATMQLLLRNDKDCPPHLADSSACGYGLPAGSQVPDLEPDSEEAEGDEEAAKDAAKWLHGGEPAGEDAESSFSDDERAPQLDAAAPMDASSSSDDEAAPVLAPVKRGRGRPKKTDAEKEAAAKARKEAGKRRERDVAPGDAA